MDVNVEKAEQRARELAEYAADQSWPRDAPKWREVYQQKFVQEYRNFCCPPMPRRQVSV